MTSSHTTSKSDPSRYLIGVDVGTGSARAGIFDLDGNMLAVAKRDISLFREAGGLVEQSSAEIWDAVCTVVRETIAMSAVDPALVVGLGFDATCSLVVVGKDGRSLPVGPSEDEKRDIIVWMDHRAVDQAERINAVGHDVLRYVGGRISPEMETPKILYVSVPPPFLSKACTLISVPGNSPEPFTSHLLSPAKSISENRA